LQGGGGDKFKREKRKFKSREDVPRIMGKKKAWEGHNKIGREGKGQKLVQEGKNRKD